MHKNSLFPYKPISIGSIFLSGFAFKSKDFSNEGIPVIKIKNIQNKKVTYLDDQFFPLHLLVKKLEKFKINRDDVLIAMTGQGSVGRVGQVKEMKNSFGLLNQRVGKFICDEINLNRDYLFYVISSNVYEDFLFNKAIGSGQPNLSPSDILEVEIPLPKIPEQKAIANILSAIDDKIENNLAINKTLEDMAMALYKHWFVDFGPFQDGEFIDSELGLIPKDWEVKRLESFLEIKYGKDHKKLNKGNIPVYGSGGIMRYVDSFLYDEESILIPRKGTLSNLFYVTGPFWSVDTMFYSKIRNSNFGKYIFHFLKNLDLASMDVGSAVPSLTTHLLKRINIISPSVSEVEKFDIKVSRFFNEIKLNKRDNKILTQLRDTLLPKLINGEVRLKEFQEEIENVM
jgi:type I restriction enzyme S subunit